jgi:hypothetical protein
VQQLCVMPYWHKNLMSNNQRCQVQSFVWMVAEIHFGKKLQICFENAGISDGVFHGISTTFTSTTSTSKGKQADFCTFEVQKCKEVQRRTKEVCFFPSVFIHKQNKSVMLLGNIRTFIPNNRTKMYYFWE